jgi:hypothetical protein
MNLNTTIINEDHWHQFPAVLQAKLRRRLGRKAVIVDHQVLDIAKALCDRGA